MSSSVRPELFQPDMHQQHIFSLADLIYRSKYQPHVVRNNIPEPDPDTLADTLQAQAQREQKWGQDFGRREMRLDPSRGALGRLTGQVAARELSAIDLEAEARVMGIAEPRLIPRPALEQIVQASRDVRQSQATTNIGERAALAAGSSLIGIAEATQTLGENITQQTGRYINEGLGSIMQRVFNMERNRAWIGEQKAKIRLSLPEDAAAKQDGTQAMANFAGMLHQGIGLWRGVGAMTGGLPAAAAQAGAPAAVKLGGWLFNNGVRGTVARGAAAATLWDLQYDDKPFAPTAEQWEQLSAELSQGDMSAASLSALGIMDTRVGTVATGAALDFMFGVLPRIRSQGAARSTMQPPSPYGPTTPGSAYGPSGVGGLPAPGGQPLLPSGGPPSAPAGGGAAANVPAPTSHFQWTPPAPELPPVLTGPVSDLPPGVGISAASPDNLAWSNFDTGGYPGTPGARVVAPAVRGLNQPIPSAPTTEASVAPVREGSPAGGGGPTPQMMFEELQAGTLTWPDAFPVPADNAPRFDAWQNLPAAQFARQQGSIATDADGRLMVVTHETPVPFEGQIQPSGSGRTGPGVYTAMVRPAEVMEAMESGQVPFVSGYAETRLAERAERRVTLENRIRILQQVVRENEQLAQSPQAPTRVAAMETVKRARADLAKLEPQLTQLTSTPEAPNTRLFFPIVRRMYYDTGKLPLETVEEMAAALASPEHMDRLGVPSELHAQRLQESRVQQMITAARESGELPNGIDFRMAVGDFIMLNGTRHLKGRAAQEFLISMGFNAIHNLGNVTRRYGTKSPELKYHAVNVFDPRDLVEVFTPETMLPSVAAKEGAQLTKQAAIMGSDVLGDVAASTITDAGVVSAMIANLPYTTLAFEGVDNLPEFLGALARGEVGAGGVKPTDYAVIPRPIGDGSRVRYDALISTTGPLDRATVEMFERFGVYPGLEGSTTGGTPARIFTVHTGPDDKLIRDRKLDPNQVYYWVREMDKYAGDRHVTKKGTRSRVARGHVVKASNFLAQPGGSPGEAFLQNSGLGGLLGDVNLASITGEAALRVTGADGLLAGMDPTDLQVLMSPSYLEEVNAGVLRQMEASRLPVSLYPAIQDAVEGFLERQMHSIVHSPAAPGDTFPAALTALEEMADAMRVRASLNSEMGVKEMAAARGLEAHRIGGSEQWMLRNPSNGTSYSMANEAAAIDFLRAAQLPVEDITPPLGGFQPRFAAAPLDNGGPTPLTVNEGTLASAATIEESVREEGIIEALFSPAASTQPLPPSPLAGGGAGGGSVPPPPQNPPGAPTPPRPVGGGGAGTPPGPTGLMAPGAPPPTPPPSSLTAAANKAAFIERQLDTFWWEHVWDSRSFMGRLEELLFEAGAVDMRPSRDTYELRTALARFHNEAQPFRHQLTKIADRFGTRLHRQGKVWGALDLINPPTRAAYMQREGFSAAEMQAVSDMEGLFTAMHGTNGIPIRNQLLAYVNNVSANLQAGVVNPYQPGPALRNRLPDIQHFITHAEKLNLRLEVPNAASILDEYIRSVYMEKHVRGQWDATYKSWNQVRNWQDARGERPLRGVADYVLEWMQGVERGFQPDVDGALSLTQEVLRTVGIPLTKQEVLRLYGWGMKQSYKALLGFRPNAILGDMTQPILALPWTGATSMGRAMKEMADPTTAAAAFNRALLNGYTERAIPAIVDLPVDQSAMMLNVGNTLNTPFSPREEGRRKLGQLVHDKLKDMTPSWLRSIDNTPFDALYLYTNKDVVARAIIGNAAEDRFLEIIGTLGPTANVRDVMRQTSASGFEFSRARRVEELLAAGQAQEAARAYANTVADLVMLRYGTKEGARKNHTIIGRVGTSLGGFTSQMSRTAWTVGKAAVTRGDKAALKFLALAGAMQQITTYAERETGWNWGRYNPFDFYEDRRLGGPFFSTLMAIGSAFKSGIEVGPGELNPRASRAFGAAAAEIGKAAPLLGGSATAFVRNVTALSGAAQEENSKDALLAYLLTNTKKNPETVDFNKEMGELLRQRSKGGGGAQQ